MSGLDLLAKLKADDQLAIPGKTKIHNSGRLRPLQLRCWLRGRERPQVLLADRAHPGKRPGQEVVRLVVAGTGVGVEELGVTVLVNDQHEPSW